MLEIFGLSEIEDTEKNDKFLENSLSSKMLSNETQMKELNRVLTEKRIFQRSTKSN